MCGLVGFIAHDHNTDPDSLTRILVRMSGQLRHRGPDDEGRMLFGPVGLGHQRLSVIDLLSRSAQPMATRDRKLAIVYNGEIYNFAELKQELEALGHTFVTASDSEVLLHGYREWKEGVLPKLRGMFAFAIWDEDEQALFLARDRFGKKPLVYADHPTAFLFASEHKSILQWPYFEPQVNLSAIHDYMSFHYTPGLETAFLGIKRLPPAHYMIVRPGEAARAPVRYWSLAPVDPAMGEKSRDALAGELLERLDDAIQARLVSDVPLGVFLSGGVDSSAIVARMSSMVDEPIKSFSVGFDVEGYDETEHAAEVANRYATRHQEFIMDYSLVRELPKLIWHYGEPYADSSSLVTFALAREVQRNVTVALTGDGGDEIMLGYIRYSRFRDLVSRFRAGEGGRSPADYVLDVMNEPLVRDHYARMVALFREEHKRRGYGVELIDHLLIPSSDVLGEALEDVAPDTAIDAVARLECGTYLVDDLLVKTDIATMAVGLEARSPFLDHRFADWAASIPQSARVFERDGELEMKGLLKYALEPHLSQNLLYRPKQGFSVPVKHWMKFEIRDFLGDALTSQRFRQRGLLRPAFVDRMLDRHMDGSEDHGTRLWGLLCLELWYQTFIDRRADAPLNLDVMATPSDARAAMAGV